MNTRTTQQRAPRAAIMHLLTLHPVVFLIGIGLLFLLYAWQLTLTASGVYVFEQLAKEKSELERARADTTIGIAAHQNLKRIEERIQEMKLVKDDNVTYITPNEFAR